MRVGEIVANLATLIWKSGRPLSPTQRHMVEALRMLPEFVELRHVDLLEVAFPPPIDADDQATNRLLVALYELGRFNLYTLFDAAGTLREYGKVAAMMQEQGFDPPYVDAITDW